RGAAPTQPGAISAGSPLDEAVTAVALQDDGGIVLAGQIGTEANADFLLARFNPDGTTDRSCALFGYNVLDFGHGRDRGEAVALDKQDRIYEAGSVTGSHDLNYGVARFASNCTPDTSYVLQRVDL